MRNGDVTSFGQMSATNDAVRLDIASFLYVAIQLTGTWTGTVTFEVSMDGTTWVAFNMTPSNSGTDASTSTANGGFSKTCGGYDLIRARFSTATSGTVNVFISAT